MVSYDEYWDVKRQIAFQRQRMDECWIELESATSWEEIQEISGRLSEHGLEYKRLKKELSLMESNLTPRRISGSVSP